MCVAAPAGGPGAGAGPCELADPHGGGGGREQWRQCHSCLGEQTSGNSTTHTPKSVLNAFLSLTVAHLLCRSLSGSELSRLHGFSGKTDCMVDSFVFGVVQ